MPQQWMPMSAFYCNGGRFSLCLYQMILKEGRFSTRYSVSSTMTTQKYALMFFNFKLKQRFEVLTCMIDRKQEKLDYERTYQTKIFNNNKWFLCPFCKCFFWKKRIELNSFCDVCFEKWMSLQEVMRAEHAFVQNNASILLQKLTMLFIIRLKSFFIAVRSKFCKEILPVKWTMKRDFFLTIANRILKPMES